MYEANFLQIDSCWRSLNPLTWTEHKGQWMKNWILMFFFHKWDIFRKLYWLYRFLKKNYGFLKKCTDWFKKMYGLYGFLKKIVRIVRIFFSKIVRISSENLRIFLRISLKKFWPPWIYFLQWISDIWIHSYSFLMSYSQPI